MSRLLASLHRKYLIWRHHRVLPECAFHGHAWMRRYGETGHMCAVCSEDITAGFIVDFTVSNPQGTQGEKGLKTMEVISQTMLNTDCPVCGKAMDIESDCNVVTRFRAADGSRDHTNYCSLDCAMNQPVSD